MTGLSCGKRWSHTRRRVAVVCLGLWVGAVSAQVGPPTWTLVRSESGMRYHLDTSTLRMQGPVLHYWILVSFRYDPRFNDALPYRSARILRYADCTSRTQDTKSVLQYRTPMGLGEPIWAQSFDDATLRLEPVEPGSLSAQLLDKACSLRK